MRRTWMLAFIASQLVCSTEQFTDLWFQNFVTRICSLILISQTDWSKHDNNEKFDCLPLNIIKINSLQSNHYVIFYMYSIQIIYFLFFYWKLKASWNAVFIGFAQGGHDIDEGSGSTSGSKHNQENSATSVSTILL